MAWDPVCWMEVDEDHAPETAEVAGRRVCFCSRGCRAIFERAPATYWSPAVPAELKRLPGLTKNLWWTWHPDAQALFRSLGPPGSQSGGEPILLLRSLGAERLEACAKDAEFLERYRRVLAAFDTELRGDACWFGGRFPGLTAAPVAYFSAEFGLHSSLPVYSGGLGVLAGDIAKEATDLGVPMVGVGFMYPEGYFRQRMTPDGRQQETHERLDRSLAPVLPACAAGGQPCVVAVDLPHRTLHVAVWVVRVGRVAVYLMDTDLEANAPWDRELSARLYAGDQELRLRQEILLGIGGVRVLRALGIAPGVWHANEGHSAFLTVERVRELVEAGCPSERAVRILSIDGGGIRDTKSCE